MDWISKFQLFCFDFDGLLVNTELLHCKAYEQMLAKRGQFVNWDFYEYCEKAHYSTEVLRDAVYQECPELKKQESDWNVLREEKQVIYQKMLQDGKVEFMPGAKELILALEAAGKQMCVVTNSTSIQINAIKEVLPDLNRIPGWLTREDYGRPKPNPDGYLEAIKRYGTEDAPMIGFEDTAKGLRALLGTSITPVLVCANEHPQLRHIGKEVNHFTSLESVTL